MFKRNKLLALLCGAMFSVAAVASTVAEARGILGGGQFGVEAREAITPAPATPDLVLAQDDDFQGDENHQGNGGGGTTGGGPGGSNGGGTGGTTGGGTGGCTHGC